ncbi:MAG TPA: hypothetical protein VLD17_09350 [Gemmatimonadaceae bacterium]|nr:hypothetical protein [Gemmatimonadaceae bacterium]
MLWSPQVAIEAHPQSATVYLTGRVSVAALIGVLRRCDSLPNGVWLLRVDASAAEPLDAGAHAILMHGLRRWRAARSGAAQSSPAHFLCLMRDARDRARRDPTVTRSRSLRYAADAPFHTTT